MFKCTLGNKLLTQAFMAISTIIDTVQIQTDTDGFRLNALDRGHIIFCNLDMKHDCFNEYVCTEPEKINLDTGEITRILKRAKPDDTITLETRNDELKITFDGEAKRTFHIRLIDMDYDAPVMPSIEYSTILDIPTNVLKEAAQDIKLYSDKLTFKVDDSRLIIETIGDMGDAHYEYLHGEKITRTAKATFSLEKIEQILKAERFSKQSRISMGDDRPILWTYTSPFNDARLSFLLAPRIESED